jgi:formylglycine-generating enzyme required for sulfatase activity
MLFTGPASAVNRGMAGIPSPTGFEVEGENWLFVIGINNYRSWGRLTTAVNDAMSFRDVLLERYYFDESRLVELYDEEATRDNIIQALREHAGKVGPNDSLVIFYAGHGHLDPLTKKGSWIPVESDTERASSWISNQDIKDLFDVDVIRARHILLISDSCFAGDFFRDSRGKLPASSTEVIKRAWRLSSRQAMTSGGLEPVTDAGFGNNSVFSHFLIKALRENRKQFLVPSGMFPDVKAGVARNAEQFPRLGSLHGTGGQGGELVFFLRPPSQMNELLAVSAAKTAAFNRKRELEAITARQEADREAQRALAFEAEARRQETDREAQRALAFEAEARRQETDREAQRALAFEDRPNPLEKRIASYSNLMSRDTELGASAWKILVASYPEGVDLAEGDVWGLRKKLRYSDDAGTVLVGHWYRDCEFCPEMLIVPAGEFRMGNEYGADNEKPAHSVEIAEPFGVGKYEVTFAQWDACHTAGRCRHRPNDQGWGRGDRPVMNVSWTDAQAYVSWLSQLTGQTYRLLSESEWEYAARGGSTGQYSWGGSVGENNASCDSCGSRWDDKRTAPVGSFPSNGFGLHDMHGNVWEWTEDCWNANYSGAPGNAAVRSSGTCSRRAMRGGSWTNRPDLLRSANRDRHGAANRFNDAGFRVAQDY